MNVEQRSEVSSRLSPFQRVPLLSEQVVQVALTQTKLAHGEQSQHVYAEIKVNEQVGSCHDRHEERLGISVCLFNDLDQRVLYLHLIVSLGALALCVKVGGVKQREMSGHHYRPQRNGAWLDLSFGLLEQSLHDGRLQMLAHLGQTFVNELLHLFFVESCDLYLVADVNAFRLADLRCAYHHRIVRHPTVVEQRVAVVKQTHLVHHQHLLLAVRLKRLCEQMGEQSEIFVCLNAAPVVRFGALVCQPTLQRHLWPAVGVAAVGKVDVRLVTIFLFKFFI